MKVSVLRRRKSGHEAKERNLVYRYDDSGRHLRPRQRPRSPEGLGVNSEVAVYASA